MFKLYSLLFTFLTLFCTGSTNALLWWKECEGNSAADRLFDIEGAACEVCSYPRVHALTSVFQFVLICIEINWEFTDQLCTQNRWISVSRRICLRFAFLLNKVFDHLLGFSLWGSSYVWRCAVSAIPLWLWSWEGKLLAKSWSVRWILSQL